MPVVSVLMPCYNAAATLPDALRSLKQQTLTDFEIIAVDDGSSDDTLEILGSWAAADSRLRVLACRHGGIIAALNEGLAACSAPYIARMDADDCSHAQRLEYQVAFLNDHPEIDVVSCRVTGFPAGQVRQGFAIYLDWLNALLTDDDIRREIFVESPLPHPSLTFRRESLLRVGGYQDRGWAEDYDLLLRLYLAGARFAKLEGYLLEWREHPQRLTRVDSRYSLENFLRAKAYYLTRGPLAGRDSVIVWGAGMVGRRLGKHLLRQGAPLTAYIDIDPRKIGRTRRGLPILSPEALPELWRRSSSPVVLAAVGARGARQLIRQRLTAIGLREGQDWWGVA
ncbi:MAG: glycosyltransferase [Anaerolineales bacterium]|nr:glycosyltransferase [Anaerolineales bacterium]